MSDLRELYQEMIMDHGRHPRNFGVCAHANHIKEGFNPLCGDKVIVQIYSCNGLIKDIQFQGNGCAISMASASLMTEAVKNNSLAAARELFACFHQMLTKGGQKDSEELGKLTILSGVAEFPMRVKCATLAWHTLMAALEDNPNTVSTE